MVKRKRFLKHDTLEEIDMASKKQDNKKQETKLPATTNQETSVPAMPDHIAQFMDQSRADAGSMAAASVSVPRLSYRGKRWRFIVEGEEELVKELTVDVIVVGVEPDAGRFIKTFYTKGYTPGDNDPPECSSSDGVAPDIWVSNPQASRCASCPKNVFGSAQSRDGGKAKACHDGKRLWLMRPHDLQTIYGLNVPIMSLKNLSAYGRYIAGNNFPLALVITQLSMDDESEFPKLCFKHVGFVEEKIVRDVIKINERRPWKMIQASLPVPSNPSPMVLPERTATQEKMPERKQGGEGIDKIIGEWK